MSEQVSRENISQPSSMTIRARLLAPLRYGDNPHQAAAVYVFEGTDDPYSLDKFTSVDGEAPSASNYFDLARGVMAATRSAANFDVNGHPVPSLAFALKHGNACGAGYADSPEAATRKAIDGDLEDIFGSTMMFNFGIDEGIADLMLNYNKGDAPKRVIDVVSAPSVTDEAVEMLRRKAGKLKLLVNPALASMDQTSLNTAKEYHGLRGIVIVQESNTYTLNPRDRKQEMWLHDKPFPVDENLRTDTLFAEGIGSSSTSNTITVVREGMLVGNGVGQKARHKAARLAVEAARLNKHKLAEAAGYSDSFFVQPDGIETLIDAGITEVFTMRGSTNDQKVMDAIRDRRIRFISVPVSVGRGFLH